MYGQNKCGKGKFVFYSLLRVSTMLTKVAKSLSLFQSLACLSFSIMSKPGPSTRELHIDYSIDCPVYLGRQTLLQGFRHVYSSQECQIISQRYFPHPTRGGDSTDQTSQPNLHTKILLTLSIPWHTIKCYYSTLT